MAKSSRYMQGLLGVIASGRRRKPVYIRQQALVSKLYPFFFEESINMNSSILAGGELTPANRDIVNIRSIILSGGKLSAPIINYDAGLESLNLSSSILTGGIMRGSRNDYDASLYPEVLSIATSIQDGGSIVTVALRYDSTTFDTETLTLSSSILAGGTIGS